MHWILSLFYMYFKTLPLLPCCLLYQQITVAFFYIIFFLHLQWSLVLFSTYVKTSWCSCVLPHPQNTQENDYCHVVCYINKSQQQNCFPHLRRILSFLNFICIVRYGQQICKMFLVLSVATQCFETIPSTCVACVLQLTSTFFLPFFIQFALCSASLSQITVLCPVYESYVFLPDHAKLWC